MSVQVVGRIRPSRRALLGLTAGLLLAVGAGYLAGGLRGDVPPVFAAYCQHNANYACGGGTTTSSLAVSHHTAGGYATQTVVEPDDGERWAIASQWCNGFGGNETIETAYATVSWNGSSWVLSNVALTTHIVAIRICQGDKCDAGGGATHSWGYTLIVDITDPHLNTNNLAKVTYTTTEVDDGYLVMDPTETQGYCYLDASVSPTTQTFSAEDAEYFWGSDRSPYDCTVTGASVTLYYE